MVCRIELIKKSAISPSLKAARRLLCGRDMKSNTPYLLLCKITAQRNSAHPLHTNQTDARRKHFFVCHSTFSKTINVCLFIFSRSSHFLHEHAGKFPVRRDAVAFHSCPFRYLALTVTVAAFQLPCVSLETAPRCVQYHFSARPLSLLISEVCTAPLLPVWPVRKHWNNPFHLKLSCLNWCQRNSFKKIRGVGAWLVVAMRPTYCFYFLAL